MHFYKNKGAQHLSLDGDLVLTREDTLATCSSRSAMPVTIKGGHLLNVSRNRLTATWIAFRFIWGRG